MKDIEPGKYDLSAQRPGFGNGAYGPTLSLDAGQRLSGIIVRLTPNAVVTGRILDEDGEPLAGVNVSSWRYAQGSRKKELWPGDGGDKTNDLSEYRLYGLSPGRYYIQATRPLPWMEAQSQGRSAGKAPEAFAPTYYPGTTDVNKAVAVELKAGAQIHGIDFAFFRIHAVHVRGRMQYPADAGRRPVMLALAPRGSGVYARWTLRRRADIDDPDGKFELTIWCSPWKRETRCRDASFSKARRPRTWRKSKSACATPMGTGCTSAPRPARRKRTEASRLEMWARIPTRLWLVACQKATMSSQSGWAMRK